METKICSYCKEEKDIKEFRFSNGRYRGECRECERLKFKLYRKNNPEKVKQRDKISRERNIEKRHQNYKKWAINNKEYLKEKRKKYYIENKEYFKTHAKRYGLEHRTRLNEYNKKWKDANIDKFRKKQRDYNRIRRENPIYKLQGNVRNMLNTAFKRKNYKKSKKLKEICGCSIDELINHLIMTYEKNYNLKWDWQYVKDVHIDHIIPLASAKTEEDVIKLCHYSNLQLLKAEDNLKKGSKII